MPRSTIDAPAVATGLNDITEQHSLERRTLRSAEPSAGSPQHETSLSPLANRLLAGVVCTALLAVALTAGLIIESFFLIPNIVLVFLPVVLFAAVRYGFWAAAWTSVVSIFASSYFLTDPRFTFAAADAANVWALLMFVVVSAFTSSLAAQVRERAAAARRHSHLIEELYAFSSKLAAISAIDELALEAVQQIDSMLRVDAVLLLPEHGKLRVHPSHKAEGLDARDLIAAGWCWEHGQPAGRGSGVFHGVTHLYLRLNTSRGPAGVLGIHRHSTGPLLSPDDNRLLDALGDQVAVSLERARLAEEMHETEMLAATERLRTALLTSISHDLKTPLASILGNVTSLRQYGHLYDEPTRSEMLTFAENETLRLSRFVDNLLHMTRIDAGALRPTFEAVDLSDLIGAALQRCEKLLKTHRVVTQLAEDLAMVPLDFVLAEHVLVNLLDNAAKYTPKSSLVSICVSENDDDVEITVMDEGPGIAADDLQHVFERFFRAKVADHRPAGVGLGLAICRGFVEAMGGGITVNNRNDCSGAMFTMTLPKSRPTENAA
jgi:two-component system sensor histidine kinase KdpD